AAVGLYGLVSYSVEQRTREIGIRVALGAQLSSVVGLIVGQGVRIAALGVVIGTVATWFVAQVLSKLLSGVTPRDPVILTATAALLAAVAVVASFIPARRAAGTDPLAALRSE